MCCGQKATYHPTGSSAGAGSPGRGAARIARAHRSGTPPTRFEYTGPTRLTVRAPLSGRTYVFEGRGAVLDVEARDGAVLLGVPALRPVRG
jgi:hypothetical protein